MALMASCREKVENPDKALTMEAFSSLRIPSYVMNSHAIRRQVRKLIENDKDSMWVDFQTKRYYQRKGNFLWIDRYGVDQRADTLLRYIRQVGEMGFRKDQFCVHAIETDLHHLRTLDFNDSTFHVNRVLARLEYHLTKAYLRYATGQRFGYVNPKLVFNRLEVKDSDSTHVSYRGLFDIPMDHPGSHFMQVAFQKVSHDSVAEFLREIQPESPLYYRLLRRLNNPTTPASERPRLLCNMERCRWRLHDYPQMHRKYVFVNIPSFHLYAVDEDSVLSMRIGCGTFETKTPLLTSKIKRMDINPQWIVPQSIVEKSILRHAGNSSYFNSHRFFIRERSTGKKVEVWRASYQGLKNREYLVIQEGGEGNALGRIIFRFDNSFSVFLHDTSSRDVFQRTDRGVSHGCVRVEKPFDLAVFLLEKNDRETIGKIKYSMLADVSKIGEGERKRPDGDVTDEEEVDTLDRSRLIGTLKVEPKVPLFITYYTIYPDQKGHLREYGDVYGYDRVIYQYLRNYR